jgi:hypothetical protein
MADMVSVMAKRKSKTLLERSAAFRLMLATSWLAPELWQDHQERAIRAVLSSDLDWNEYLELVERHGTPALSWEALKRMSESNLPETVRQALRQRSAANRMRAMRLASLLMQVLKDFNQAGIPLIPLKGPLLALELYGDSGIRHSRDIDIMVPLGDVSRAQAQIEGMGWRVYLQPCTFSPRHTEVFLQIGRHMVYWHPLQQCRLELHWNTRSETHDRTAGQWARSATLVWNGLGYRALSPVDLALYLCTHGSEHDWFRSKWLGDLARMYATNYVDWNAVYRAAHAAGLENSLLQCLRLLEELHGLPVPKALREPARRLPALLLDRVGTYLLAPPEIRLAPFLARLRMKVRRLRYERLLRPRRFWRQAFTEVAYSSADFRLLRLPDRLFWLYVPLRPILLAWRCLRHIEQKPPGVVQDSNASHGRAMHSSKRTEGQLQGSGLFR